MLAVGKFLSTFGVKGFIKLRSYSGNIEHLATIKMFYTSVVSTNQIDSAKSYEIETWHIQGNKTIRCKILGFDSPESVHCFVGQNMYVPRAQATRCEKGEYYISDLIGMHVMHIGKMIGVITAIFTDTYVPLLEITIHHNSERTYADSNKKSKPVKKLIPFMKRFVSEPLKVQENGSEVMNDSSYGIELYDLSLLE